MVQPSANSCAISLSLLVTCQISLPSLTEKPDECSARDDTPVAGCLMGTIETNQSSPVFATQRSAAGIVARHIDSGHFPTVDIILCNDSCVDDAQRADRSQKRLLSVVESEIERWKFRSVRTDARIPMFMR